MSIIKIIIKFRAQGGCIKQYTFPPIFDDPVYYKQVILKEAMIDSDYVELNTTRKGLGKLHMDANVQ